MDRAMFHTLERSTRVHPDGLTPREIRLFETWIERKRGKVRFVLKNAGKRAIFEVRHRGRWWPVVACWQGDGERVRIVTVLPPECFDPPW